MKKVNKMAKRNEFVVVTQKWWQGAPPEIHSKHHDKKKALAKAKSLFDSDLKDGQNAFVVSKTVFKKKFPAIFREEY